MDSPRLSPAQVRELARDPDQRDALVGAIRSAAVAQRRWWLALSAAGALEIDAEGRIYDRWGQVLRAPPSSTDDGFQDFIETLPGDSERGEFVEPPPSQEDLQPGQPR